MSWKKETTCVHNSEVDANVRPVTLPIYQSSTYCSESNDEIQQKERQINPAGHYGRYGNPNSKNAASIIAQLEGAQKGLVTPSGMSAITMTLLSFLKAGDHIVAQRNHYGTASSFIRDVLPQYGIESSFVDQEDNEQFVKAIQPNTKVLYCESPSNPVLKITDLGFVATLAKERKLISVIDNTFATPANQQPIKYGFDLVLHSATKYLGGHSDLVAGAVCGSEEHIDKVWKRCLVFGTNQSAFDGWLLTKGLKTFSLRMKKHNENAMAIATFFQGHGKVKKVFYPGLERHPQHDLAKSQMSGFGGILCVELELPKEKVKTFFNNLTIPALAPSVGGVETLIVQPVKMMSNKVPVEQFMDQGLSEEYIRISVGIEDIDDLVQDFSKALENL